MIHLVHYKNIPADSMENHLGREEIREALEEGRFEKFADETGPILEGRAAD